MFVKKNSNNNLRQPKVFQAPREVMKNNWSKIIFYLCLVVILIVGIVYMIFFSSWFKIKNIEIIGSPSQAIKSNLDGLVGKNLFSFDANKIEQSYMESDKNYSKIKIYRGIPDTIRIIFEDREPKIIWQTSTGKYFIDQSAIAFKEAEKNIKLPIVFDMSDLAVNIPSQVATENFVDFVRSADIELSKIKMNVVNYEVGQTTFQVSAITDQNIKIMFNTLRPLSDQIDAFTKVYNQNKQDIKEYIDLRVEGKVYFK